MFVMLAIFIHVDV